jgi:flagellar hook-length control protein FliK
MFGSLLPPSQLSSNGLIAEQPDPSPRPTSQSSQLNDARSQDDGSDAGTFRDALKRAGKHSKSGRSESHDTRKAEKATNKPAGGKPVKAVHAAHLKHANTFDAEAKKQGQTRLTSGSEPAGKDGVESDDPVKQSVSTPGDDHRHPPTTQNNQATPAKPANHPAAAKPAPTPKLDENGAEQKDGPTASRTKVRAVDPKQGGSPDDADTGDVSTPNDAAPTDPVNQLAAETAPGSTVVAATGANAITTDLAGAAASDPSDDVSASTPAVVVSSAGGSGVDLLSDLATLAVDPTDDPDPAEQTAAKPVAVEPQGSSPFSDALGTAGAKAASTDRAAVPAPPEPTPDARFADVNNPKIVTGLRGQLLPNGGSMQLRLDPPELGDLQISVHMRDGIMTAAFQTSNDQATRLLSHSLGNLKSMLEAQGVNVDKLHVQQAPRSNTADARDSRDGGRQPAPEQRQSDRREQQRKELIQKMWDKLAGKAPVDVVA